MPAKIITTPAIEQYIKHAMEMSIAILLIAVKFNFSPISTKSATTILSLLE